MIGYQWWIWWLLPTLSLRAASEHRLTCGGGYGWGPNGPPCPDPQWEPNWALNLSTAISNVDSSPMRAAAWGLVTISWDLNQSYWQDVFPHPGEEVMTEQCRRIKLLGTGTKCMVYRQNELSLQWQKTSRDAQTPANADMYLQFKTKQLCNAAAPCNIAAFHQMSQSGRPLVPCNKSAPLKKPNCAYCCNFSSAGNGVYNEPIGGMWPSGFKPAHGNNALQDGQLFFDFRNPKTVSFWAQKLALGAVNNSYVDGIFTDDPAGYGQEHPQIQSAVQLSPTEITALQTGTQRAWSLALRLFVPRGKYFWNALRGVPGWPNSTNETQCAQWMKLQCKRPANQSAVLYAAVSHTDMAAANLSIAAFLVTRGPHSFVGAHQGTIEGQDKADPFFAIFQLDVGSPMGDCVASSAKGHTFSRKWSHGMAMVNCSATGGAMGVLQFGSLMGSASPQVVIV